MQLCWPAAGKGVARAPVCNRLTSGELRLFHSPLLGMVVPLLSPQPASIVALGFVRVPVQSR